MRTMTKNIYKFDELPEKIQDKAIENERDINVDHDWWDWIYEDAETIGLKIEGFDLGRGNDIDGRLTDIPPNVIDRILKDHGKDCETYKVAERYQELFRVDHARRRVLNEAYWDELDSQLEHDFQRELLECYLTMLNEEYDYQTSEEGRMI